MAAASVSASPGSEYIRRAHDGSRANASPASDPHSGRAGVSTCTQPRIGGRNRSRTPFTAAGVTASDGRIAVIAPRAEEPADAGAGRLPALSGGRLEIDSPPGVGTRVRAELPCA